MFLVIFSYSIRSSIQMTSMILVMTASSEGVGFLSMVDDFFAISGSILVIRSNFSLVFARLTFLLM